MAGLLSQSLANLQSAEGQITNLTDLPAGGVSVQSDSLLVINKIASEVAQLQGSVNTFVSQALPQLNTIQHEFQNGSPIDLLKTDLLDVHNEAAVLNTSISQLISSINSDYQHIIGYANILDGVNSNLNLQISGLNAQIGTAQGKADAAQKKYYYLIGLAPLALFGAPAMLAAAATAIGIYYSIKSDIDGYQKNISSLNNQISRLNMMQTANKQLTLDFSNLVNKITNVENSLNFLSGDIQNSINDIDNNSDRLHIAIFVQTAITEIQKLQSDAS